MTDTAFIKPSLGVGAIIGESFSILFRQFIPIITAMFLPLLITMIVMIALLGSSVALGQSELAPEDLTGLVWVSFGIAFLCQMVAGAIGTAMVVQLAYDTKLGRPASLGASFSNALNNVVPIIVLSIVAGVLMGLAMIALIIPGLYVYAMWSVLVPAIVVERVGFGALGRSAALTKEYRWPVLGTLFLVMLCMVLVSFATQLIVGAVFSSTGAAISVLISTVLTAVPYGLVAVTIALIYARLREIKEGVSIDSLVEVFA